MRYEFLVVGAGLTGATIARHLHDTGHRVLVVDQRDHVGGNVHDHLQHGIRVHTYGPHYFRTNNERIWSFVNRFGDWYRYEPALLTDVGGRLERWPVSRSYIEATVGPDWEPEHRGTPQSFEEACLAMMPRAIYEDFVKGYTEKQWGRPAHTLAPELAGRFAVAPDDDPRLKDHKHQGIPVGGYSAFTAALLDGIPVELGHDHLRDGPLVDHDHLVFTGPIDAFHGHRLGRLAYRGQRREHRYLDVDWHQPCGQVNNPGPGAHVRTLEWKHMLSPAEQAAVVGTVVTTETPGDGMEYPYPDARNAGLYERYRAIPTPHVTICGRLGEYRYYDMDQAIGRALVIAKRLAGERPARSSRPASRTRREIATNRVGQRT